MDPTSVPKLQSQLEKGILTPGRGMAGSLGPSWDLDAAAMTAGPSRCQKG